MPVTVYKSTDASAPVLNGQAGSLVTVLDAVLVNGYGAKAAAGWTKPYTGTNKAAYRMNSASGAGLYLRVQDDAPNPTLGAGCEARLRGHEAMSAIDTGTGPFPTAVQIVPGIMIRKSTTPDATARPWIIIADDRTLYMFVNSGDYANGYASFAFGEFYSLKSTADAYRCILIGRTVETTAAIPTVLPNNENLSLLSSLVTVTVGHYVPRNFSESPATAVAVGKHGNAIQSTASLAGLIPFPNPIDGGLYLSQVWVHEQIAGMGIPRGRLRGFWHFLHPVGSNVADGDTFAGTGATAGKNFLIIKPTGDALGVFIIETSDTWETN